MLYPKGFLLLFAGLILLCDKCGYCPEQGRKYATQTDVEHTIRFHDDLLYKKVGVDCRVILDFIDAKYKPETPVKGIINGYSCRDSEIYD